MESRALARISATYNVLHACAPDAGPVARMILCNTLALRLSPSPPPPPPPTHTHLPISSSSCSFKPLTQPSLQQPLPESRPKLPLATQWDPNHELSRTAKTQIHLPMTKLDWINCGVSRNSRWRGRRPSCVWIQHWPRLPTGCALRLDKTNLFEFHHILITGERQCTNGL